MCLKSHDDEDQSMVNRRGTCMFRYDGFEWNCRTTSQVHSSSNVTYFINKNAI